MKRILLANQSRVTLELIKVYLVVRDVQVLDARNGSEALAIAQAERPDLILCDLNLPGLDGPELCRALQADQALRDIPVIMIIGNRDAESLRRCRDAGACAILTRPIRPRQLHEAVQCHTGIAMGLTGAPTPARTPAPDQPPAPPSAPGLTAPSPPAPTSPPAPAPRRWWSPSSRAS